MIDYKIAASILSADIARLGEDVTNALAAGTDFVHFDVMDNHYVPNLTFGPIICQALRDYGIDAPIDVHLMVKPVDKLITDFAKAGATYISIHPEATEHLDRSLQLIKDSGCKAGIALNPATTLGCLEFIMDKLDMIVIMSVNPGFAGQQFIASTLEKIAQTRALIDKSNRSILLEIDGGIKTDNIKKVASFGADTFVLGSGLFHTANYAETVKKLRINLC